MQIALLTDTHLALGTERGERYQEQTRQIWAALQAQHPDLILMAGDLTEAGRPQEFALLSQLMASSPAPVWVVPGNHDVGNKGSVEGAITSDQLQVYEKAVGPSYFTRTHRSLRVVGINSSLLGSGLDQEEEQWAFLGEEFSQDLGEPRVLLTHYPLFIQDPEEAGGGYWTIEPGPRSRLLDLIKGKVAVVLSGHLHRVVQTEHLGMTFLTGRPASFGIPDEEPVGWLMLDLTDQQMNVKVHRV